MGAGVSAAQEAERSRRAAAEHRRRADAAEQRAAAFEAGERGELIAAAAWRAALPPGCHVWDDVRWPGRPIANIDGVVVGPFGLIVWDAKHWSGRVTVSNGTLRQGGYRRDEKLLGAQQAVAAVLQAARLPPVGLPVLCLTGAARVPQPTVVAGVTVLSVDQLAAWLAARPRIVSPEAVSGMAQAAPVQLAPTPGWDPFSPELQERYGSMIDPRSGIQQGVLRLVTGGPLALTRPIAVSWRTQRDSVETYRGNPNFDSESSADEQSRKTFDHFDKEVTRLRSEGWWLSSIDGRNLVFER